MSPGQSVLTLLSASRCGMAAGGCLLLLLLPSLLTASHSPPGCKIRITSKGLDLGKGTSRISQSGKRDVWHRPGVCACVGLCLHCSTMGWPGGVGAVRGDAPRRARPDPASFFPAVKQEGLHFVEQELQNITVSDLHGNEGQFQYNISQVKVTDLQLAFSDLSFQPQQHLVFNINNASISLRFRRQLLYWFFYDIGSINASADGVHIYTVLQLAKDEAGRLKISNMTCNASIARMHAGFSGTLRKVYEFLSTFIVTGMRFLLSQQVQLSTERGCGMLGLSPLCVGEGRVVSHPSAGPCPASAAPHPVLGVIPLSLAPCLADLPIPGACQPGAAELFAGHSAWYVLPWERDWIPFTVGQIVLGIKLPGSSRLSHTSTSSLAVRNYVDEHIGIDYSLLRDPSITTDTLELDFKGMFFPRVREDQELENHAVEPVIKETERMVYVAFSEYFFDSAMHSYFQAGVLTIELQGEKVPKDLEVLLRATFFGTIFMLSPSVDAPLRLVLQVSAPPRCTIKPSGTSVSVSAFLNISLVPPDRPPVQLSSMAMETKLSAKVFLQGKALRVQLDLRRYGWGPMGAWGEPPPHRTHNCFLLSRFRIYSKQSALESLALFSLQAPLKTLLQLTIMPIINERTKKGVQIPLPEGMDFTREVVTNHAGFLTVGADLHFSKGLREVIEKYRPVPTTAAYSSSRPAEPSLDPSSL
ncbi:phospholipid transfer protein isoform X2 [Onychostruthus taczanowskii]|uniref:phospholipid transfer protein isoform X2 n=1 Tax=Onychostruthus taczanowskii TaxID=356909 RepID=UPI001B7FF1E8|nr:phospholipid transfer protein isoform X2 [Onychostruthus taczanowskii]